MRVGYARTSTIEQEAGFEAQVRDLKAAGCEKIFSEQVSSIVARAQLEAAIDYIRDTDVLVVTKIDRLARSVRNLMDIVDRLKAKGAGLAILNMSLDTTTPTGELMLQVLGAVAQFERSMMLERQKEGIAKAQREGKMLGRRPNAFEKADEILQLLADGCTPSEVAQITGIGRSSVYRIKAATREEIARKQSIIAEAWPQRKNGNGKKKL